MIEVMECEKMKSLIPSFLLKIFKTKKGEQLKIELEGVT